jgi:hypothetical protein
MESTIATVHEKCSAELMQYGRCVSRYADGAWQEKCQRLRQNLTRCSEEQ